MIYLIGFYALGFFIGALYIYHDYAVFRKNKSIIKFEISNNPNNIDWMYKHPEINKVPIKWYGVKLGDSKTKKTIANYKKTCINLILGDIFPNIFKIVSNNLVDFQTDDFDMEYKHFKEKSKKVDEYEKKNNKKIEKVFKSTKRKAYNKFIYDFDFTCKIEGKQINIIRFLNMKEIGGGDPTSRPYYTNAFIGYVISIPEFRDLNKLNKVNKKDYYYDEKNKILTLIVSDQINSKVYRRNLDMYYPEDYYKQENGKNMYFNLYYSFYTKLKEYILLFI